MGYSVIECTFHLISKVRSSRTDERVGGWATTFPTDTDSYEKGGTASASPDELDWVNGIWGTGAGLSVCLTASPAAFLSL